MARHQTLHIYKKNMTSRLDSVFRYLSTLTPTIYINNGCLPVSAVGVDGPRLEDTYELTTAEEYRGMYWYRIESNDRNASEG
jgi:hypothetical protein